MSTRGKWLADVSQVYQPSPTWRVRAELQHGREFFLRQHKKQEGEALNWPCCLHIRGGPAASWVQARSTYIPSHGRGFLQTRAPRRQPLSPLPPTQAAHSTSDCDTVSGYVVRSLRNTLGPWAFLFLSEGLRKAALVSTSRLCRAQVLGARQGLSPTGLCVGSVGPMFTLGAEAAFESLLGGPCSLAACRRRTEAVHGTQSESS